jgi:transcriptional regulator with XRE-family HTH domain
MLYSSIMDKEGLKTWRRQQGLTQRQLAEMLGVSTMAVAYWEWGKRSIPALLPLALEALENRMKKEVA